MPRRVILFTGPFADLPLAELAPKASEWGYAGLDLCCWGDHLEVQHALGDTDYSAARLSLLASHDLQVPVLSNHRVGQAVCDRIDERHNAMLPDYVWGDGDPEGVRVYVRPQPPALAGCGPGRIRAPVSGPDLSRAHQGRGHLLERSRGAAELISAVRRPAAGLGVSFAGPRRHRLGRRNPRPER